MINLVNRYKQLLSTVPKGSFYASDGQVLPFRGDQPYELRITTSVPNRQYGVFINDQLITLVTTDGQGIALITTQLAKGRNDIRLVDSVTQNPTLAYITTRDYATLMAAEAEVLESIDENVEQVLLDARLVTSSIGLIESVFGQTVGTGNSFGYDLDTYRELLMELRTAYRYWGGVVEGIARVVRAFTQISPLIYPVGFGPVWILGKDIISPQNDTAGRIYYTTSALTNVNAGGANVTVDSISNTVGVGTGTLKIYTGSPKKLSWTPPNGSEGLQVNVPANGAYELFGLNYFDPIIGVPGPYNIIAGRNDIFALDVDGHGIIDITLTAGGARTATQIATDINTVLAADPRYGSGYNSVADSYDLFVSGSPMIRLTTPNGNTNGYIRLMPRSDVDATQTLFNVPVIRGGLSTVYGPGTTSIVLNAATDMSSWPTPDVDDPLTVIIGGTRFHPTGTPSGATTATTAELVYVTNVNRATKTLTLALSTNISHNGDEIAYVQGEWPYLRSNVQNSRSITVNVGDFTLLPGSPTTDSVAILGTGAPSAWIVTTNAGSPVTPTGFTKHTYFALDRDLPFDLNANGMVTMPIPDEVLKYKGFDVNVSVWGRIDDPSRAATQSTINTIGVSFDDQSTYDTASPTVAGLAVNAEWRPQEFIRTLRIPAAATKMWVRVKLTASGVGNFTIHKVRVTVPAHGGLFLGDGTTPRLEQKIKQGSFMYCWSHDPLTAFEDSSLGLTNVTQVNPGHIDNIAPTESWLEKFDITEYDVNNNALNAVGVFTEDDWITGVATNLELVLRTPPRFSHMKPTVVSDTTQVVQFPASPSYTATLTIKSDQNMLTSVLLQDGVPLTQDQWQYNNANTIEILTTPISVSVYELQYQALIRFETTTIDLTSAYTNYVWFADFHTWLRPEIKPFLSSVNTGIQFDATGAASLSERSTQDQSAASLIEDTGLSTRVIPSSQWRFVDAKTIQIDLNVFNTNGLYEFQYEAETNFPSTDAMAKVELRSASSPGALTSATYAEVQHNQPVDQFRYHQIRVTLSNIRDLRDARVQSLLLKGLNMFGVGGTVPLLRP